MQLLVRCSGWEIERHGSSLWFNFPSISYEMSSGKSLIV